MRSLRHYLRWPRVLSLLLVPLIFLLVVDLSPRPMESQSVDSAVSAQYAQLPLAFEPNHGQTDSSVQYLVHHGQATTYFTGSETITTLGGGRIAMRLSDANELSFAALEKVESVTNYFIGNDASAWRAGIPNYRAIATENVYPGIDLKFYGNNSHLEHDFIVDPTADYTKIAFSFDGQDEMVLDDKGNLVLKLANSSMMLRAPITYQDSGAAKRIIPSAFELHGETVRIALNADYDRTQPLIIDPTLVYSTYLGGFEADYSYSLAIDAADNVYVSGQSDFTSDFPVVSPFQVSNAGGSDAFVAKFNAAGNALLYSTYLGGSGIDWADGGLAVDSSGNAYVSGNTSSTDFPTQAAFQGSNAGGTDAFITVLDPLGSSLIYSTYLGGSGDDFAVGKLAVDSGGSAYVSGNTDSSDFPTSSPLQGSNAGGEDMFLAKFDALGSTLLYATYIGGSGDDIARNIALDSTNNAYIVGYSGSSDFPTNSPFQGSNAGGASDATLTKVNPTGSALVYSTYLGGSADDEGYGIDIDSTDNAYITGVTGSGDFPTAAPFQAVYAGGADVFLTKFDASGTALVYSTYLGGGSTEHGRNLAVDSAGNAFISGITASGDFPIFSPYQPVIAGGFDLFVMKFSAVGSVPVYSTYLGGVGSENTYGGIAVDSTGHAYVSGYTDSTDFPTSSPFQATYGGGGFDAFVAKIAPEEVVIVSGLQQAILTFILGSTVCDMGIFSATQTKYCTHTIAAGSNAASGYVISYIPTTTLTSGAHTITAMATQTGSILGSEQFGLNLRANTSAGSFTSGNFGADPSGGTGTVMTGYSVIDQFKFVVGGENIAQAAGPSNLTTFTASFIANITAISEAGLYATPVTYNIVASY